MLRSTRLGVTESTGGIDTVTQSAICSCVTPNGMLRQVTILALIAVPGAFGQSAGPALPEGRGRAEFQRICGNCHGVQIALQGRFSEDRWAGVVDDMVGRGASGTQDEFDRIIHYLAVNFGPMTKVAVNSASAKDLAAALGVAPEAAEAIVKYRDANGKFKDLSSLEKVPGLDLAKVRSQKDRLDFSN